MFGVSETTLANMRPDELARWAATSPDPVLRQLGTAVDELQDRCLELGDAAQGLADAEWAEEDARSDLEDCQETIRNAVREIVFLQEWLARHGAVALPRDDVEAFLGRLRTTLQGE